MAFGRNRPGRLTGVGVPLLSVQWEYVQTNKELARRVMVFLEDRRVLHTSPEREDYEACRLSVNDIRHMLTSELLLVRGGGALERSFKRMRVASTNFVTQAGPSSEHFFRDHSLFVVALESYRDVIGEELGVLSYDFGIELPDALLDLVPQQDLSWLPGVDLGRSDPI